MKPLFNIIIIFLTFLNLNFAVKLDYKYYAGPNHGTKTINDPLKLNSPNGGEKLFVNQEIQIWFQGEFGDSINFEITTDGGTSWESLSVLLIRKNLAYWYVTDTPSKLCKIRIRDSADSTNYDESDDYFWISREIIPSYDFISVNECFMWIGNNGMSAHNPLSDNSGFYWPGGKEATITSIFQDGIVWGGIHQGMLKVNGSTFREGLTSGNLLDNGQLDTSNNSRWRIYKILKNWETLPDDSVKSRYQFDYENWPGDLGAPFVDLNGDGIFTKGIDEPDFIGDEVLFYVANDLDSFYTAYTYGSAPIGLEFQQTLFAYNSPELKDVIFKKVKIINRSASSIDSMFLSYWADIDLGFAGDDFIGCDTVLNLGYSYNGDNFDEDFYGSNPPAVGHLLLQGPIVESTENDSAHVDGKILIGHKNLMMNSFSLIINGNVIFRDPSLGSYEGSIMMYNYMNGLNWDGTEYMDPFTGKPTNYFLPGDPVNSIGWYAGDGWPDGQPPSNIRYMMTSGPFTMAPGDTQEVVYAIFMARGSDNIQSVAELKKLARKLHEFWGNDIPVSIESKTEIVPNQFSLSQNYPNPFNPTTTIKYTLPAVRHGIPQSTVIASDMPASNVGTKQSNEITPKTERDKLSVNSFPRNYNVNVTLIVYDILGRKVKTLVNQKQVPGNYEVEFNASKLASGMYFYRLNVGTSTLRQAQYGAGSATNKFVAVKKMMLLK